MGLKSAEHGVKSDLQKRAASAFRKHETLAEMRRECGLQRAEAVAALDGNVLLRAVPAAVQSVEGYVAIFVNSVKSALEAATVVVVVFGEPEHMSAAKQEEQARRDAASRKTKVPSSFDLAVPNDDSYGLQDVAACADVHLLMDERASRSRFIDHVCVQAKKQLEMLLRRWAAAGHSPGAVLFDGVDVRGAERPAGEVRKPMALMCDGGNVPIAAGLLQREHAVGEGDVKIMHIERALASLCNEAKLQREHPFLGVKLYIVCTIDTDSFAIEVLEEARRRDVKDEAPFSTVLCMRERPKKNKEEPSCAAYYLCADIAMLTSWIGNAVAPRQPELLRNAVALAVAGWAVAGCDFVALKGARASVNLDAAARLVLQRPESLLAMQAAWSGDRAATLAINAQVHALLREASAMLEKMPRLKNAAASVAGAPADVLRRTTWTLAYWCGHEFRSGLDTDFGFLPPCPECSDDL